MTHVNGDVSMIDVLAALREGVAETVLSFQEDRDVRRVMPGGWALNGI